MFDGLPCRVGLQAVLREVEGEERVPEQCWQPDSHAGSSGGDRDTLSLQGEGSDATEARDAARDEQQAQAHAKEPAQNPQPLSQAWWTATLEGDAVGANLSEFLGS